MKFEKRWLQDLLWDDVDDGEVIENRMVDTSRWSVHYDLVFKFGDKFYRTHYSRGATENQDESPFEYELDEIECEEVSPKEKTIVVYEAV